MSDEIRAEQMWQAVRSLIRAGNSWKAKELLRTIFLAFPAHAAARSEYAAILYTDGEIDNALVHAAFAYKLNPELPGLPRRLGELYFLSGFYSDALECLEHATRTGDKDNEVTEKIVICKEILKTRREAQRYEGH